MFFVWFGGKCTHEQKLGRFPHKESAHTHFGLLSRVERRNEREKETKCINSKNAPSALERHRSQI